MYIDPSRKNESIGPVDSSRNNGRGAYILQGASQDEVRLSNLSQAMANLFERPSINAVQELVERGEYVCNPAMIAARLIEFNVSE